MKRKYISDLPLYLEIAEELKINIFSEKWKVNMKIPSEAALCEKYHVSRVTVRKSIDELIKEELAYRIPSKGAFVGSVNKNHHITLLKSFSREMVELGEKSTILFADIKVISATKKIASHLHVNRYDKVMQLKRIEGTHNEPYVFYINYFTYSPFYSLDSLDYYGSFYNFLASHGININQETEDIEAIIPDKEVQNMLSIDRFQAVLKRVRKTRDLKSDFREYSECYYIGNKYKYCLELN